MKKDGCEKFLPFFAIQTDPKLLLSDSRLLRKEYQLILCHHASRLWCHTTSICWHALMHLYIASTIPAWKRYTQRFYQSRKVELCSRFSSNPDNVRIIWNCLHEPQIISKPQICIKLFITILWWHISGLNMQDKQASCVDMRLIYDNNVRLI